MSKMNADSIAELMQYIEMAVEDTVELTANDIKRRVQEYIKKELYESYNPTYYVRTYDFINSVIHTEPKKTRTGWTVDIKFDTSKITPNDRPAPEYNQHKSFRKKGRSRDMSKHIPKFIEEGTNNPYYSHKGINSMETVSEKQINGILHGVRKHLEATGLDVRIISS